MTHVDGKDADTITNIITFLSKIEGIKSTLRHNRMRSGRQESVAEHSRRLAILMLLIQSEQNYDIDLTKALKIALIHDIPEVIDGDTPGFEKEKNPQHYAKKELLHAKQIFDELPSPMAEELYSLYVEYEEQSSKEAKFIKALDKLETNLQHMESGPLYRSDEERGEHMLNYPNKALSQLQEPFVDTIWEHIKTELEKLTYT